MDSGIDRRAAAVRSLGDALIAWEAPPAAGVVKFPEQHAQHGQELVGQHAVVPMGFGPMRQRAGIGRDPGLGISIERDAAPLAELLFTFWLMGVRNRARLICEHWDRPSVLEAGAKAKLPR